MQERVVLAAGGKLQKFVQLINGSFPSWPGVTFQVVYITNSQFQEYLISTLFCITATYNKQLVSYFKD